jgi:hypothetical protein
MSWQSFLEKCNEYFTFYESHVPIKIVQLCGHMYVKAAMDDV